MSKNTKGITFMGLLMVIAVIILIAILFMGEEAKARVRVRPNNYYTYGIANDLIEIAPGKIITEVTFNIQGISHQTDDSSAALEFYLVDNPPIYEPWISNVGDITGDDAPQPSPPIRRGATVSIGSRWMPSLLFTYQDNTAGYENVSFKLSDVDIPDSWVWDIFDKPFNFILSGGDPNTIVFSSTLLEFIDYAGTGDAVGLLIDPKGTGYFQIERMEVIIKIETFEGDYSKKEQTIVFDFGNRAPVIF